MIIKTPIAKKVRNLLILSLGLPLLAGCFGAAVVGTGAGVLMLTDRRNSETYIADEAMEIRAAARLLEKFGDKAHVNVTSYNRMLLLTGEAPNAALKAEVEKVASEVPNVKTIANELAIAGPSGYGGRSNDALLTAKVKARFVDANKFAAQHVKVVTEAGIVFLLGIVTRAEANHAIEIASTTGGVLKVVHMLDIISVEQAKALDAKPKPANQDQGKSGAPAI
jgi:osmotically-inducible protein OsmY